MLDISLSYVKIIFYCCLVAQSCPTLYDPIDCISQARTLKWVTISFSRGSSQPRGQTHVSWIGRQILYHWATREAKITYITLIIKPEIFTKISPQNSIETSILSRVKQITNPGWMHKTSAQGWCTGKTQRDGMGREAGGGIRMGNTCKSMTDSC